MGPKKKGLMALTKPELINKINDLQNQLKNSPRKENSFNADDVDDKLQNLTNFNEKILTRLDSLETNIKFLQDENSGLKKSMKNMEKDIQKSFPIRQTIYQRNFKHFNERERVL